ncbi:MAG: hypothetical protein IJV21_03570, partial [Lachnospiraceae bacterium]|nr:hypothetical protein [Lachnospiraceae bacterium]
ITEKNSAIEGFEEKSTSVKAGDASVVAKGEEKIELRDDYEEITTGKLTFTKSVKGGVTKEEAEGALTFTIYNETTKEYMVVDEDGSISWSKEETAVTLSNLSKVDTYESIENKTAGTFDFTVVFEVEAGTYTITEKNSAIEGFEPKSTSVTTGGTELAANGKAKIELTDEYNKLAGNLKITKTIDGHNVTEDDLENLTFTVTGPEGFGEKILKLKDFKEQEDGTYVYEFKDIPLGDYAVEEVQANIPGYEVKTTFKVDDEESEDGKTEVKDDETTVVEITDEYTEIEKTGNLKITKTIAGDKVTEDDLENLTFRITGPEGFDTVTVTLGEFDNPEDGTYVYERKGIPLGEYTVEEIQSNIPGYEVNTTIKVDDEESEDGKAEVRYDETTAVDITDEYTQTTGKLTFTKTVTGGVTEEEAEGALTFTIYNETTEEYMVVDEDGNISWSEEETEVTLANLSNVDTYEATENEEAGTFEFTVEFVVEAGDYTITEKNSAIEGFEEKSTSVK